MSQVILQCIAMQNVSVLKEENNTVDIRTLTSNDLDSIECSVLLTSSVI